MKKFAEIIAHIFFWLTFTAFVVILSQIYLHGQTGFGFITALLLPCIPGAGNGANLLLYNISWEYLWPEE